jgi:hypothetical protein
VRDETRWRSPSVCPQDPPRENGPFAHPDSHTATDGRSVLCDCHCGPMYYFPLSLIPASDFVMCWVSDCGRCYNKSLGYFRLRARRPTLSRVDEASRRMARCPGQNCPTTSSMAVTRLNAASGDKDETRWHCFECGGDLPFQNVGTLWEWFLRSFVPPTHQKPPVRH